jgi:hypothetical protein
MKHRFCATLLALTSWSIAMADGVVAHKQQKLHSDASANAFAFRKVELMGPVTWFTTSSGRIKFERHQIFEWTAFPAPLPQTVADPVLIRQREAALQKLRSFALRYKKASPLLDARIRNMEAEMANFNEGSVLYESRWVKREEYEIAVKLENEARERRVAEEKRLAEEAERRRMKEAQDEADRIAASREATRERIIGGLRAEIRKLENEKFELNTRML